MRQTVRYLALALTALAVAAGFWWRFDGQGALLIEDARAIPLAGEPGSLAVVLTIRNQGGPDQLLGVASSVTENGSLALTSAEDSLPIPAASQASLALDGAHLILRDLGDENEPGRLLPLTLRFAKAGDVAAKARVEETVPGAASQMASTMAHGAFYPLPADEPAPGITLTVAAEGDRHVVRLATERFRFAEELVDQPHQPGTGHGHLYVGGMKLGRLYAPEAVIGALPPGRHEVRVTLNTNDHRAYLVDGRPISASAWVTVE